MVRCHDKSTGYQFILAPFCLIRPERSAELTLGDIGRMACLALNDARLALSAADSPFRAGEPDTPC
jgi:hypothetical protein